MNNPTDEPWPPPPRKKKRSPTIRNTTVALAFLFQYYYYYFQSNANVVIAWTPTTTTTTTTTIHHHRRRPIRLWSKPSPQVDGSSSSSSSGSNVETRTKVETTSNSNNNNKKGKKGNKSNANNALSEKKTTTRIEEPCNVVFTHTNADFDTLAAAVALSLLWSKKEKPDYPTHVVLPRGVHPIVQRFLAFHKHLLPLRGFKTILPEDVYAVGVVDAQSAGRIGRGQSWLSTARSIHVFDHHDPHNSSSNDDNNNNNNNNPSLCEMATELVIDKVGSTTTILVERLKEAGIQPKPHEATLFVLGIRADTGGLVYESTTIRDAAALLWCLENGASQSAISEFAMARIGSEQRTILNLALQKTKTNTIRGLRISAVLVGENEDDDEDEDDDDDDSDKEYVAGLAQVCEELLDLTNSDVYILGATHQSGGRKKKNKNKKNSNDGKEKNNKNKNKAQWVSLIGRASPRAVGVNLNNIMHTFGGGGHPKAAAAAVRCGEIIMGGSEEKNKQQQDNNANGILQKAMTMIEMQIPEQLIASTFMVPIDQLITISAEESVTTARRIFEENDLKSAPVIDPQTNQFRGSLKYNDLIKAIRSGRQDDKVRGMLRSTVTTILPDTPQADLEELLIEKGVGRIPVVDDEGALVGLVTRTDVLRQHNLYENRELP